MVPRSPPAPNSPSPNVTPCRVLAGCAVIDSQGSRGTAWATSEVIPARSKVTNMYFGVFMVCDATPERHGSPSPRHLSGVLLMGTSFALSVPPLNEPDLRVENGAHLRACHPNCVKPTHWRCDGGPYLCRTAEVRHSRRGRMWMTERTFEDHQSQETETRGGCCLHRFVCA